MPLFSISGGSLSPIKLLSLNREKDIQTMTEKNLELIFGLKFVCSEFQVGNFRLDTIGFDGEANSFTIIEYKKDQNFSIIDQGFAYLSLMLNHKSDFVLRYNEKIGSSSVKPSVDWSQSKILFLSPSFTQYQVEAINFKDLPIELWEVHWYANDTIRYERIKSKGTAVILNSISKTSKVIEKVGNEIRVFTEDAILKEVSNEVREAFIMIKNIVHQVNPDVDERIKKTMACFYTGGKGLLWVKPTKKSITIWLRKGKYLNRNGQIIQEGWGHFPELRLPAIEIDPVFTRKLIEQANNL